MSCLERPMDKVTSAMDFWYKENSCSSAIWKFLSPCIEVYFGKKLSELKKLYFWPYLALQVYALKKIAQWPICKPEKQTTNSRSRQIMQINTVGRYFRNPIQSHWSSTHLYVYSMTSIDWWSINYQYNCHTPSVSSQALIIKGD